MAHARDVAVEAELGELPHGASGGPPHGGHSTDPTAAAEFVAATGVDLLAVSVGNVHIMTHGQSGPGPGPTRRDPPARCHPAGPARRHGHRRRCPARGHRHGRRQGQLWDLPQAAIPRRRPRGDRSGCPDPHHLLGIGGPEDVLVAGRRAVRDAVLERIGLLGCCGKASSAIRSESNRTSGEELVRR